MYIVYQKKRTRYQQFKHMIRVVGSDTLFERIRKLDDNDGGQGRWLLYVHSYIQYKYVYIDVEVL